MIEPLSTTLYLTAVSVSSAVYIRFLYRKIKARNPEPQQVFQPKLKMDDFPHA